MEAAFVFDQERFQIARPTMSSGPAPPGRSWQALGGCLSWELCGGVVGWVPVHGGHRSQFCVVNKYRFMIDLEFMSGSRGSGGSGGIGCGSGPPFHMRRGVRMT